MPNASRRDQLVRKVDDAILELEAAEKAADPFQVSGYNPPNEATLVRLEAAKAAFGAAKSALLDYDQERNHLENELRQLRDDFDEKH